MRSGALLTTLLAAFLMAGCASDSPSPASEPAPSGTAPVPTVQTDDVDFGGSAATTPAGGFERFTAFSVPKDTARLQADAEWSCVSLCPLHVLLVTPGGDVAAEGDGGSSLTLEVQEPSSGDWQFVWRARDGATVEPAGTVHLTFEVLAAAGN